MPELVDLTRNFCDEVVVPCEWLRLIVAEPPQHPIVSEGVIAGWHEVNIVHTRVGLHREGRVLMDA